MKKLTLKERKNIIGGGRTPYLEVPEPCQAIYECMEDTTYVGGYMYIGACPIGIGCAGGNYRYVIIAGTGNCPPSNPTYCSL